MEQYNRPEIDAKNRYPYAQRLMENMGWSGQGLGAEENGITEPIRIRTKSKPSGLGFYEKHDQHIDRQDDFNEVLLRLNESHANETTNTDVGFSSLENKSKSSRHRVHYHKFTRGKDLSRRSEQEMQAILGKRGRTSNSNTEFAADTDQLNDPAQLAGDRRSNSSTDIEFEQTESGLVDNDDESVVAEASKKNRRHSRVSVDETVEAINDINSEAEDNAASSEVIAVKTKRKTGHRDHSILLEANDSNGVEATSVTSDTELTADTLICRGKKNKKRKSRKAEESVEEDECVVVEELDLEEGEIVEERCDMETTEVHTVDTKKKRKQRHMEAENCPTNKEEALNLEDCEIVEEECDMETTEVHTVDTKKKRKQRHMEAENCPTNKEALDLEEGEIVEEECDIKTEEVHTVDTKKKRKRRHMEAENGPTNEDNLGDKSDGTGDNEMTSDSASQLQKENGHRSTNGLENCVEHSEASERIGPSHSIDDTGVCRKTKHKRQKKRCAKGDATSEGYDDVEQSVVAGERSSQTDTPGGEETSDANVQSTDVKLKRKKRKSQKSTTDEQNPSDFCLTGKRNLKSLKLFLKSMKGINMFKGSNFLKISGYPVVEVAKLPKIVKKKCKSSNGT